MVNAKWDLSGVHGIRSYLWSKLQSELEWKASDYGGSTPVVPASQQPQLNDYNRPYVVYNYAHQTSTTQFWMEEEQISFVIYSANEKDIRQFINLVRELFKRRDESARDINAFVQAGTSVEQKRFDYKYTYVTSSMGAQPPVSEGGRQDGSVSIRIGYTYYDDSSGKERLAL
jgi:hypothetical protein